MLILVAALAQVDGNADYAKKYWPTLVKWADYLKEKGLDPENQLCTDDFAGHLAHNTNLSLKAIVALGAFAKLSQMAGRGDDAEGYRKSAEEMAAQWMKMADDGDHYRLTFDKPGTWSQKYNLVWINFSTSNFSRWMSPKRKSPTTRPSRTNTASLSTIARPTPSSTGSSGPRPWPTTKRIFQPWSIRFTPS